MLQLPRGNHDDIDKRIKISAHDLFATLFLLICSSSLAFLPKAGPMSERAEAEEPTSTEKPNNTIKDDVAPQQPQPQLHNVWQCEIVVFQVSPNFVRNLSVRYLFLTENMHLG